MRQLSEQEIVRIHEDYVRQCLVEIVAVGDVAELANTGPLVPACKAVRSRLRSRCAPDDAADAGVRLARSLRMHISRGANVLTERKADGG